MNISPKLRTAVSSHSFFSAIFVLFIFIIAIQITLINRNFKTNDYYYPLFITAGTFFFLVKSFLSGFNAIDRSISKNMWAFLVIHSVTLAGQIWFAVAGLAKLTSSSYPNEFFLYAMVASSIYLISAIVSQSSSLIPTAVSSFAVTTVSYIMVYFLLFGGNTLFLQIISLIFLAFQIFETFLASHNYFAKKTA